MTLTQARLVSNIKTLLIQGNYVETYSPTGRLVRADAYVGGRPGAFGLWVHFERRPDSALQVVGSPAEVAAAFVEAAAV